MLLVGHCGLTAGASAGSVTDTVVRPMDCSVSRVAEKTDPQPAEPESTAKQTEVLNIRAQAQDAVREHFQSKADLPANTPEHTRRHQHHK